MGNIYAGAVCTIASTGSGPGDGGCFHERNPLSLQACKIGARTIDDESPGMTYIQQDDLLDYQSSPLNQRGWVFQERLLSKRILHFGLYWECHKRSASELNVNGYVYKNYPDNQKTQKNPEQEDKISQKGAEMGSRRRSTLTVALDNIKDPESAWKNSRNAWREASDKGWEHDTEINSSRGFRAELDVLRRKLHTNQRVGFNSFIHCWYGAIYSWKIYISKR